MHALRQGWVYPLAPTNRLRDRIARFLKDWCGAARSSSIWLPKVCSELNDVIGSWKIIEIAPPRMERISLLFAPKLQEIRSSEDDSGISACTRFRRRRSCLEVRRSGVSTFALMLFPQPLSPTIPIVESPGSKVEIHAIDRPHYTLVSEEMRHEVAHRQNRFARSWRRCPRRLGRLLLVEVVI